VPCRSARSDRALVGRTDVDLYSVLMSMSWMFQVLPLVTSPVFAPIHRVASVL
jgi:hypothetical protein